jgi:hypothetical protein
LEKLPRRTWYAIKRRAKQLGLFRGFYIPPLDRAPKLDMSETDRVWIACAIDCEGHISLYKSSKNFLPRIGFCNSNRDIVEEFIRKISPKIKLRVIERSKVNRRWADKYYVHIFDMGLNYSLLKEIRPYLIVKKKQADLVMEFIEVRDKQLRKRTLYDRINYDPRLSKIVEEVRKLNGK